MIDINKEIASLGLSEIDKDEAECIFYAHALKTKLYMLSETSHEWNEQSKAILDHELSVINS